MKIAILGGTGKQGSGLALRWGRVGQELIIGSRRAEKGKRAAAEINETLGSAAARGLENAAAAAAGEVVVLTVPARAHESILRDARPALAGKVLIDVTVPLDPQDRTAYAPPSAGSAAEAAQALLGQDVAVAAAFHNVSFIELQDLHHEIRCDVLVCGDSNRAKEMAIHLAELADLRAFDAGPLRNARIVEGFTAVLMGMNRRYGARTLGLRITGLDA